MDVQVRCWFKLNDILWFLDIRGIQRALEYLPKTFNVPVRDT